MPGIERNYHIFYFLCSGAYADYAGKNDAPYLCEKLPPHVCVCSNQLYKLFGTSFPMHKQLITNLKLILNTNFNTSLNLPCMFLFVFQNPL